MTNNHWELLAGAALLASTIAGCSPRTVVTTQPPPTAAIPTIEPGSQSPAETPAPAETAPPPSRALTAAGQEMVITSEGKDYKTYLSAPTEGGPYPGIVLIHSINGQEPGYLTISDRLAAEGFVVAAIDWQTFERNPPDDVVQQLTEDTIAVLTAREDVDPARLGLTGFCAGGRYTMLLLPQIKDFRAGVAWYGFPYSGQTQPASLIDQLNVPMLIIHGSADSASPVEGIYRYADELKAAGKDYEIKVYDGEPHGFMLKSGQMRTDAVGDDAFNQMVEFFRRKLG